MLSFPWQRNACILLRSWFWDIKCLLLLTQIQLRTLNYIFKGTIIYCYSSLVCANQSKLHLSGCNSQFVSVLSGFNRVHVISYSVTFSMSGCAHAIIIVISIPHLYRTNLSININQNNREISTTEHCINWY